MRWLPGTCLDRLSTALPAKKRHITHRQEREKAKICHVSREAVIYPTEYLIDASNLRYSAYIDTALKKCLVHTRPGPRAPGRQHRSSRLAPLSRHRIRRPRLEPDADRHGVLAVVADANLRHLVGRAVPVAAYDRHGRAAAEIGAWDWSTALVFVARGSVARALDDDVVERQAAVGMGLDGGFLGCESRKKTTRAFVSLIRGSYAEQQRRDDAPSRGAARSVLARGCTRTART